MRTVYLPTANTESLILKVESLQAQLQEQKKFTNERVAALLEDRRIREADEELRRKMTDRRHEELVEKEGGVYAGLLALQRRKKNETISEARD